MKPLKILTVVAALAAFASGSILLGRSAWSALTPPTIETTKIDIDEFGSVEVVRAENRDPRGLVILVANETDAQTRRQDALALAKADMIAVSFDFDALRAELAKSPPTDECHYISDDMKDLAQAVQRKLGLGRYFFPVIAGRGDGAAFAYAALAQAPVNTLGGAIGIGFKPLLKTDRTYCFDPKLEPAGDGYFTLRRIPDLPDPWRAIAPERERQGIETFQGSDDDVAFVLAEDDAATRQALVDNAVELGKTGERGASQLPVSIIRPEGPVKGLAVIISGDGGWRDIDKSIGEWLSQKGVAVVGLDSLRYFWSKKSPKDVASDLALLFDHYGAEFGTNHYAIVGFSFGSDIMPDVWPELPKAVKDHVNVVSLLALGTNADFEVTVEGFIGAPSAESRPLAPLLHQLPLDRTQCIYGREEADDNETSCTAPELGGAQRVALEGGHHFDGDYGKAAEAIWTRMKPTP
ncbi:virulence factor family protein [Microvirga lotononidis]|uniref:Type IV secretory pathway, VirJ component n=1 Tax=Microvirga lotononidis TaxID=864069 RepID=I4YV51_9HYPH|nr:AcvB/VirJ family lysyl-phosphatidylglycerol hydrolase [Microvirga lotononidis]EIM27843.1 type IV secretory pathway, VirJ component [Microvirga lotononidis]WQO28027.1 AcvB/VirJ family lysyl-phosphatidylglycerol hydrolase [Microvirga lotononidis]